MKEKKNVSEAVDNTNPFPIYPDIENGIDPAEASDGLVSDAELTQQTDTVNPDPNSLDRG
ncbi:hypothetical protein LJB87_01475 [Alistipes sp. OttesenSCG-928-L06]|nr:hypothetical protein [Alistipes sp. OttesenSCG-928-L06]